MGRPRSPRVPLERALSKLGLASRNEARRLIESGRVKVHGKVNIDPHYPVTPETAAIVIDGQRALAPELLVLALHKTRGTVTTRKDEKGRQTVFDILPDPYRSMAGLHAVGRLDQATTGLLLLTNDTRLSSWLTDPETEISRTYAVTVRGEVTEAGRLKLETGFESEAGFLSAQKAFIRKSSARESHLEIELAEGRNREIRRLCSHIGHEVTALRRLRFGAIVLGTLSPGEVREIPLQELDSAFPGRPRSTTLK